MNYVFVLLQPMAVLLGWSGVMLVWMYFTRIPAMKKAGVDLKNRRGGGGSDLDKILPPEVQWISHNYNHLMEQPTLFYACCIALVILGDGSDISRYLAWGYVGLRIAHSIVQVTSNRIAVRFPIFILASLCLLALIAKLLFALFL